MSGWNEAMAAYARGESGNADNWLADRYAALQDNTRVPHSEANIASGLRWLANLIPRAKPELPNFWSAVLPTAFTTRLAEDEAIEAVKFAKNKINDAEHEAEYRYRNLREGLINEAANRYISKSKK
jgi:hypothetical protein